MAADRERQLGAKIVYTGSETATATDLTSLGASVIAAHPDGVAIEIFPNFVVPVVKQIRAGLGANVPIIGQYGVVTYQEMQTLADPNLYAIGPSQMVIPGASGNSVEINALVTQLAKVGVQKTSISVPGLVSEFGYTAKTHLGFKKYYFYAWDKATNGPALKGTQVVGSLSLTSP
jgi:hypothetical protein